MRLLGVPELWADQPGADTVIAATVLRDGQPDAPPAIRRDQWGRYVVVGPGGGKPKGYTRATTVAKTLDDGGGLIPWKATIAMTGMMRRPGLRGRFEALMSEHPGPGPWYGSEDSKAKAKKLVEECAEAGGASDRADVGTALHAMVEQINRGVDPHVSQDSTRADLDAYLATTAAAGITFDRNLIEAVVVDDTNEVAGTADMLHAHVPGLGDLCADLKTGADLKYSWQSIAVQLAIYAGADAVYHQGFNADGSDDRRQQMPSISQDHALVIHLPAGEARCTLYVVDIATGREAYEHSMWTRRWRKRRDIATVFTPIPVSPAESSSSAGEPVAAAGSLTAGVRRPPPGTAVPGGTRRDTLVARYNELNRGQRIEYEMAMREHRADEARQGRHVDPQNLDVVEMVLAWVEPFTAPAESPMPEQAAPAPAPAPVVTPPDEGAAADPAAIALLRQRFDALTADGKAWVGGLIRQGRDAGVDWRTSITPSIRRFELGRAVTALAAATGVDDVADVIRGLAYAATNRPQIVDDTIPLGAALGTLNADEATTFAQSVDDYLNTHIETG